MTLNLPAKNKRVKFCSDDSGSPKSSGREPLSSADTGSSPGNKSSFASTDRYDDSRPPVSISEALASEHIEYYEQKERRDQDYERRSRSDNYQLYDVPPPVSLWDACTSTEGDEKYEKYIRNGGLERHLVYLRDKEKKAQESEQYLSGHHQQGKSIFSLERSSGFAGFYIVVPEEYGARSTAGHASFGKQNFFDNSKYGSNAEILRNNSNFFKEKCAKGQFISGSESDTNDISMLRISPEATQRGGIIAGVAEYRVVKEEKEENEEEETRSPIVQHDGKKYAILSWQPIKKVWQGHYVLLGCLIDFANSYVPLPLSQPSTSLKNEIILPTLIDQFINTHESLYKNSCLNVTKLTKSGSYSELTGEGIIKHAKRSTFFGMTFENRTFTILKNMKIIDENGQLTADKAEQFKSARNNRKK